MVKLFDEFPKPIDIDAEKNALDAFSHIESMEEDEAWDLLTTSPEHQDRKVKRLPFDTKT